MGVLYVKVGFTVSESGSSRLTDEDIPRLALGNMGIFLAVSLIPYGIAEVLHMPQVP